MAVCAFMVSFLCDGAIHGGTRETWNVVCDDGRTAAAASEIVDPIKVAVQRKLATGTASLTVGVRVLRIALAVWRYADRDSLAASGSPSSALVTRVAAALARHVSVRFSVQRATEMGRIERPHSGRDFADVRYAQHCTVVLTPQLSRNARSCQRSPRRRRTWQREPLRGSSVEFGRCFRGWSRRNRPGNRVPGFGGSVVAARPYVVDVAVQPRSSRMVRWKRVHRGL